MDANDSSRHYQEAAGWIERQNWDMAQAALQRGFAVAPDHSGLRFLQAYLHYRNENFADATESLDMLLSDDPQHFDARLLRARLLRDQGALAECERLLLELLAESPENPDLLAHYALTVLRAGQSDKADALIREALARAPDDSFVLAVAVLCDIAQGRETTQGSSLDVLMRSEPDAEYTLRLMTFSLYNEHKLAAAQDASAALVRLSPRDPSVVRLAAAVRYQRHWSMLPLYPMMRWGWGASIAIYASVFIGLRAARGVIAEPLINAFLHCGWYTSSTVGSGPACSGAGSFRS
jgi:predicted Zn-dependent protease